MSLRILLADESSTIKKAFEIGLNSFGAEIKNVQHGIDVLEVAEHFNPDIIFADILISKMNGYEVCAQIKQHKKLGSTPVVLMWSGFMDIDEDKYFTCQADGKLEKPFSADQLMSLIQTLVPKQLGRNTDETHSMTPSFEASEDLPPPLPKNTKTPESQARHLSVAKSPTDDLLLKEDIEPLTSDDDFLSSSTEDSQDDEDYGLDGFQALDLHDPTNDPASQDLEDFFGEEYKEITAIPTPEEEAELLNKVREDSQIRHGHGFLNQEMQDELSNPSIDLSDLDLSTNDLETENFSMDSLDDLLDTEAVKESSHFNASKNSSQNGDDIFSTGQKNGYGPKTIHRDVDDLHNSDSGMLDSEDDLLDTSSRKGITTTSEVAIELPSGVQTLTKDELKKLVQDQAKEMIQSIVWELVPEISKQMIEKEIKRLLAEDENLTP